MMNIVRNMKNDYHFNMLLFTEERRYYDDEFENYGKIFRMNGFGKYGSLLSKLDYYVRAPRIYKFVKEVIESSGPYDIIHCNNNLQSAPCLKAAYDMKIPVRISHFHGLNSKDPITKVYNTLWKKISINYILKYATDIIACSKASADSYFGAERCKVICNAIDLNKFNLQKYKSEKEPYSFIHVGSFSETKNQRFIVEIFAHIKEKFPAATLKLVGWSVDNYINLVKETAVKYDVLNSIKFLPHDSDIPMLFSKSKYMIFPSKSEGFGIVVVEAQAMGVKCFISDAVSMEADAGLCTQIPLNYTSEEWANIIIDSTLQQNFQAKNINDFSMSKYISKIKKVYENGEK